MQLYVNNETSELESVVLGIGFDRGVPRGINPLMRKHIQEDTFPTEEDICREIKTLQTVFENNGVNVIRPENLSGIDQIFTRDIGFVIEDYFFVSNMKHPIRSEELKGIKHFLKNVEADKIIEIPKEVIVEGGDVILWNDFIFIGVGDRTTESAVSFLKNFFPDKTVLGFDIIVDQENADNNILHLDCTFQPIGKDEAIIYYDGFQSPPDDLLALFPKEKRIEVTLDEKNRMFPNVFSISPKKIIVEKGFLRLKEQLLERNYEVFDVDYSETSKLSGLLRCSTLPLKRKQD